MEIAADLLLDGGLEDLVELRVATQTLALAAVGTVSGFEAAMNFLSEVEASPKR